MTRTIINFDTTGCSSDAKNLLKKVGVVVDCAHPFELDLNFVKSAEVLIVRLGLTLDEAFLKRFSNLKCIGTSTTGLDHIDLNYCSKNKIQVCSLKGETEFLEGIHATPEMSWALLLGLIRRLGGALSSVHKGQWNRENFFGTELFEKTIGIIGFGRVGKMIGRYAHAFGMEVVVHDVIQSEFKDYPYERLSLDELLMLSDVVSLHLPLNEETQGYMGRSQFEKMKPTSVFINTARGDLVDEEALLAALENRQIAGAALDVLAKETIQGTIHENHNLVTYARTHDHLLITPHIAGSTFESMSKTAEFIAHKVVSYINGI